MALGDACYILLYVWECVVKWDCLCRNTEEVESDKLVSIGLKNPNSEELFSSHGEGPTSIHALIMTPAE